MPPTLTPEAWAQIRYDYEHTERPVAEICADHGISTGTLRDRIRRWRWTPRRLPIPFEGPPPLPAPPMQHAMAPFPPAADACDAAAGARRPDTSTDTSTDMSTDMGPDMKPAGGAAQAEASEAARLEPAAEPPQPVDDHTIVQALHAAIARVLPAIDATLRALGRGAQHPREMERAARALTTLTRTLRELNVLLAHHAAAAAAAAAEPRNIEALRAELAQKLMALIEEESGNAAEPAAAGAPRMPGDDIGAAQHEGTCSPSSPARA